MKKPVNTEEKLTILAIDDDMTMRMVLGRLLDEHYDLHITKDVATFNKALEEIKPDIFLLDINLPDGDGIDLCRTLRQNKQYAGSVIMLITGSSKKETIEAGYAAGASDFIRKPLVAAEITTKIELHEKVIRSTESLSRAYESEVSLNNRLRSLTEIVKNNIKTRDEEESIRLSEGLASIIDTGYMEAVIEKKGELTTLFARQNSDERPYKSFSEMNHPLGLSEKESTTLHKFKIQSMGSTIFCLLIPIADDETFKGFILLENYRPFHEEEMEIIRLFTGFFSLIRGRFNIEKSIERMNKEYKSEVSKVRKMQVGFLPDFHGIDNYDISAAFLPAADISGDFFDGFYLNDNTFQIILCDVSGHGIASSYIGNQMRTLFKIHSSPETSPAELAGRVSSILSQDLKGLYYYGTAVVIQIDMKEGKIQYVVAGHPPVLFNRAREEKTDMLSHTGPLIGLFEDNEYENREIILKEDDCLLLYTDGITEAMGGNSHSGEMYGEERLRELFSSLMGANSRDITHTIIGSVYEYTEYADQEDDITIICIRKKNPGDDA